MIYTTFTTKEEALEAILDGKPATCQDRLESHFLQALGDGLSLNQAAEKALLVHAHRDHGEDADADFPFTDAAQVELSYTEALLATDTDGRATERIDLVLDIFRRVQTYDLNLGYAAEVAWIWAAEKWQRDNSLND